MFTFAMGGVKSKTVNLVVQGLGFLRFEGVRGLWYGGSRVRGLIPRQDIHGSSTVQGACRAP